MYINQFNKLTKNDVALVGGKGASLGEMTQASLPVPGGFVVNVQAFRDFSGSKMSEELEKQILQNFDSLNADRVAVRSSALAEDSSSASWAGQLETFLNTTKDQLLENIYKCWQSINSPRAKMYAKQTNTPEEDLAVAVIVQKMVNSDISGVMFTSNAITGSHEEMIVEACYGLGESLVQGTVTPDSFVINKETLQILNRTIGDQETMMIYQNGENVEIAVPQAKKDIQKISDDQLAAVAELGKKVEAHYGKPQDIEWAVEAGQLYVLQSRPITTLNEKTQKASALDDQDVLTTGIGASQGVASGVARVIKDVSQLASIQDGEILVTHKTTPDFVEAFTKTAAVITESGGVTSHAAIVSREMGIPAVVGTNDAMLKIKTGELVTVDGYSGYVYAGKVDIQNQSESKLEIPSPTGDDIQDMVDAIAIGINDANELWPLAPGQLMPYIDADQCMDMLQKLQQLPSQGMSDEQIAELFERPIFIKMFILNTGILGMKSANVYEKRATIDDQLNFVGWLLRLAKILNQNDPNYIVSRNYLWSEEQVEEFLAKSNVIATNDQLSRAINTLSVNLLALNWALYWDYFPEAGHELHGPYKVKGYGPQSTMVVKDYFNLASADIWPQAKDHPFDSVRLAQIYDTDQMYVKFGNRLMGHNLSSHNTHFVLTVDGRPMTDLKQIMEMAALAKDLADKQTQRVNGLEPMDLVRIGAKISYFARKKFYQHFSSDWYPEAMVEATIKAIGTRFIDENANAKALTLDQKKKLWDPRTDFMP